MERPWLSSGQESSVASLFSQHPFWPILWGMLVFPSPANYQKPGNPGRLPEVALWGFYLFQWKLHEALEHLRKEQEEAWKLEVGERKRTANWKASCPLRKGVCMVPVLSWSWLPHGPLLIPVRQNVGFEVRKPGVLIPAFCPRYAVLSKPWNHLLISSLNVM